jgi:hypothetical protein
MLTAIAGTLVLAAAALAWGLRRAAPAASLGLLGAIPGGLAGFWVGASDGPAFAPAAAILGATIGLLLLGCAGVVFTNSQAAASARRRVARWILAGGAVSAAILPFLLLRACPLYVNGHAGYCSYGGADVLGGWVTPFVMAYVFDVLALAGLVVASPSWPG